ncbi:MAG: hypothetical protein ACFFCO_09700 [Promethearchaeota archaeon]
MSPDELPKIELYLDTRNNTLHLPGTRRVCGRIPEEHRKVFTGFYEPFFVEKGISYCDGCLDDSMVLYLAMLEKDARFFLEHKRMRNPWLPMGRFLGNARTKELHMPDCSYIRKMKASNKLYYRSLTDAKLNGHDWCGHCFPEHLWKYILALESILMKGFPDYFKSKIYADAKGIGMPCHSFLSYVEGWGKEEALEFLKQDHCRYIFMIFSGQQGPTDDTGDEADKLLYQDLTGSERVPEKTGWGGQFKIRSVTKTPTIASILHFMYGDIGLIIDFLNCKYDFAMEEWQQQQSLDKMEEFFFYKFFSDDLDLSDKKFFIIGAGRGGIYALKFVDIMARRGLKENISAVVTIDPTINPLKYPEDRLIDYFAVQKEGGSPDEWETIEKDESVGPFVPDERGVISIEHGGDSPGHTAAPLTPTRFFEVLHSKAGIPYFNVFQRKALVNIFGGSALIHPVGSAIKRAISPLASEWPGAVEEEYLRPGVAPYSQMDTSMDKHTPDMIEKYADWVIYLARRRLPIMEVPSE